MNSEELVANLGTIARSGSKVSPLMQQIKLSFCSELNFSFYTDWGMFFYIYLFSWNLPFELKHWEMKSSIIINIFLFTAE